MSKFLNINALKIILIRMKEYLKKILQRILFILSRAILKKYNPKVVGITGSIGKSSAKEAVFAVLKNKFRTRENIKNYNNEIGLPLTIIGELSPGHSLGGWFKLFLRAVKLIIIEDKSYPEILVLEMGIDRIGDMKYLTELAPTDIGIVTNVGPVHLEYFKTQEKIAKEKSILVSKLKPGGWGVLNIDSLKVAEMKNVVRGRFLTYGLSREAQVRALEINLSYRDDAVIGTSFKLHYNGAVVPVLLSGVLAEHLVNAALAAAAVGVILEMNLIEISEALKNYRVPTGRMNLLDGIKGTKIIDDSYNASPESTVAAVNVLGEIKVNGKKIAVLGDMLELGDYETKGHQEVGQAIIENKIDELVVVGARAKIIARTAGDAGMKNIKNFDTSIEAGEYLLNVVKTGDLILVKGSQGMRMERVSKVLLADPSRAKELLVRQDGGWLQLN
jgi:UDP-N-acetylmuramoyl-tripeptide--D-alanyl-D-alanine ligase